MVKFLRRQESEFEIEDEAKKDSFNIAISIVPLRMSESNYLFVLKLPREAFRGVKIY
jgi:hypothetical protein